jgi:dipeptidyl aminopeptidase/acylaminoacyl peptidase
VILHGGPHGSIASEYSMLRHILLEQGTTPFILIGYALLVPNYTGSTGYG